MVMMTTTRARRALFVFYFSLLWTVLPTSNALLLLLRSCTSGISTDRRSPQTKSNTLSSFPTQQQVKQRISRVLSSASSSLMISEVEEDENGDNPHSNHNDEMVGRRLPFSKLSEDGAPNDDAKVCEDSPFLPSFPKRNIFLPLLSFLSSSWKRLQSVAKKQALFLKSQGRAGLVSYCFCNFVFYTFGVWWQWQRIAPAADLALSAAASPSSAVGAFIARKFARVFGSLLVVANVIEIPKLLVVGRLTPLTHQTHTFMMRNLNVPSANVAALLQIGAMVVAAAVLWSVPVLQEYAMLTRLVQLNQM